MGNFSIKAIQSEKFTFTNDKPALCSAYGMVIFVAYIEFFSGVDFGLRKVWHWRRYPELFKLYLIALIGKSAL